MNCMKNLFSILIFCVAITYLNAQTPTPPNGKKWEKINELSDEFNGTSLNTAKWAINSPQWEGRRPARFEESSVSVSGGNLKISASKKSNPSNGWTHNGGLVRSKIKNLYGYYEARMKANKTFMSSTFWLINKKNEGSGCDIRTTELDITETVGVNSGNANWINTMIKSMNSNTHSRNTNCNSTPVGQKGGKAELGRQSWQGYHTYGVWWKNKNEVLFYLDGKLVNTITPPADFDLPMYLRMVVETYDWNPPKAGQDGMNDSAANRTTYYDWVRSYKLVDDNGNGGVDKVGFKNAPTTIAPQTSYTFNIDYEASDNREIVVEFWSATSWIAQQKEIVVKGKGTKSITVTLPALPTTGPGYMYKTHIRPMGTTWREAIDRDQIDNVVVEDATIFNDEITFKNPSTTINPARSYTFNMQYSASVDREILVSFWKNNTWIASKVERVSEGSGIKSITVSLPSLPTAGNGYAYKSHIRPIGTNWQQALDTDAITNVTIVEVITPPSTEQLITNGTYFITSSQNDQRLLSRGLENHSARMHDPGSYDDQRWIFTHLGDNLYTIKNKGTNRFLEVPYAQCGNGNNVATYTSAGGNHQKWKVIKNGNVYSFKPVHCQNVALDRAAGAINANVHTWGYSTNNNNQKWNITLSSGSRSVTTEASKENKIDLYPNPASEVIRVQGVQSNTRVKVLDFYGKVVITAKLNGNSLQIDELPSGIYFLHTEKGIRTKFVIE
ncbi:family 16 glycosylhydrolase [Aquimarina sp. 2304DJ70-9]|uniref:family 16 glycosylhydrolase n=1 Tax=Aquimarina penaris TaxID=3231044 RepID=UPI0034632F35